ncbi:hypothetical protein A3C89_02545 [Candidatus Kaiserbacteria bacterium RIFCSPHIGHO2_02_FULL_50_50]|uniref:Fibrobacter succinogenes major paralogous domain-containing protein n=1 Tax=Candidatus Kaiserbacteria bacterium RIFCSPHIGHO2_02_FULL_50_50 TaxID=1798492 RepID=A0A1F6DD56_9BACT|nr:MAG: hypothetical protein A3C89_02545 [Candidatus Kaiserbacteria bacterium RIFCSPHIGHO2_02_FULL_50_50]OGG88177.1 MAG: hypothetical protein A3G62_00260 [Candidatus Kaiserbacteria bacterium RIFCSPLOWO2_12_FULL_50_10]
MSKQYMFTALIALTFILIISLVLRYTGAADVSTSATITNTAPTVDTIRFATTAYGTDTLTSTGILPNVGTTKTIHINGTIHDNNGENDIASSTISLVFFRTTKTNTCTGDKNDCYRVTVCDTAYSDGDATQISYSCPVSIAFWIDATDTSSARSSDNWTASISVNDIAGATGNLTATAEVNSLLALTLPDAISYGTRALGELSSATSNVVTTITQHGNTRADLQISGVNMVCDGLGALPASAQKWSLLNVGYADNAAAELASSANTANRNIFIRTDDANELTANLYWNIAIPATGAKGSCVGSNTLALVAQTFSCGNDAVLYNGGPYNAEGTSRDQGGYYRTVQIGTQCWMRDNMNAGTMITGTPANNASVEKWCYSNSATNCNSDGALYHWNEAMGYSTTEGAQGICPSGWHMPTDAEYKTLEIFLGMTQVQADATGTRGTSQGTKLLEGGSALFDAILMGFRSPAAAFSEHGTRTLLWSSSRNGSDPWRRSLNAGVAEVTRATNQVAYGFSVRCMKN